MLIVYVNLVLKEEKYILGRIGLNFWGFGEQLINFGDLGSISKILLGSRDQNFQGFGEIRTLFSGSQRARTPLEGPL